MRGLQGKTAIVTGAGSGIGRAIATRLGAAPRFMLRAHDFDKLAAKAHDLAPP